MAAEGGLFLFSAKTTVLSKTPLSYGWLRGHWTILALSWARIERLVEVMKQELERKTARSCPLASIGNAGKVSFYFLQSHGICMEALYKYVKFYLIVFKTNKRREKKNENINTVVRSLATRWCFPAGKKKKTDKSRQLIYSFSLQKLL